MDKRIAPKALAVLKKKHLQIYRLFRGCDGYCGKPGNYSVVAPCAAMNGVRLTCTASEMTTAWRRGCPRDVVYETFPVLYRGFVRSDVENANVSCAIERKLDCSQYRAVAKGRKKKPAAADGNWWRVWEQDYNAFDLEEVVDESVPFEQAKRPLINEARRYAASVMWCVMMDMIARGNCSKCFRQLAFDPAYPEADPEEQEQYLCHHPLFVNVAERKHGGELCGDCQNEFEQRFVR